MNLSISFIFASLAVLYGVIALPALLKPAKFKQAFLEWLGNSNNLRQMSIVLMFMAFIFLGINWKISLSSNGIIAILGWIVLAKSIGLLWFPKLSEKMAKPFLNKTSLVFLLGLIVLVLSGACAYLAYINL